MSADLWGSGRRQCRPTSGVADDGSAEQSPEAGQQGRIAGSRTSGHAKYSPPSDIEGAIKSSRNEKNQGPGIFCLVRVQGHTNGNSLRDCGEIRTVLGEYDFTKMKPSACICAVCGSMYGPADGRGAHDNAVMKGLLFVRIRCSEHGQAITGPLRLPTEAVAFLITPYEIPVILLVCFIEIPASLNLRSISSLTLTARA